MNFLKRILFKIRDKIIGLIVNKYKKIDGWLTPSEAAGLYIFSKKVLKNSTIVEIGSWRGKSTYCLAKGSNRYTKIIAIDPFDYSGEPGSKEEYESKRSGIDPLSEFKKNVLKFLVMGKIEIKKGFSRDFVHDIGKIDLLFIDGDHSIEGCRFDYDNYSPKIKSGGFLLFHDYRVGRNDLGPVWVVNNLVLKSGKFKKVGSYDSLIVFKRL